MLYTFLSGDFPITIVIYLIMLGWWWNRRSLLRDLLTGDTPIWNRIAQITLGAMVVAPLWIAAFDNWRQLLAYQYAPAERYLSDPYGTAATAMPLRYISFILLGIVVVGCALLYVRHRNGLGLAIITLVIGLVMFIGLDPIRSRLDALLWQAQFSFGDSRAIDTAWVVFWALGLYALIAALVLGLLMAFTSALVIPLKLINAVIDRIDRRDKSDATQDYAIFQWKARSAGAGAGASDSTTPPPADSSFRRRP